MDTSSFPPFFQPRSSGPPAAGRSAWVLAGFLLLCFAVAGVGSLATAPAIPTWYAALHKPSFNPPNWVFAPVWTVLYATMAVAAWLIWRDVDAPASARSGALQAFYLQLALNFAWTPIFFKHNQLLLALFVIVALWMAIAGTILRFWKVRPLAGALLLPYLAWVSFATILNAALWRLNR